MPTAVEDEIWIDFVTNLNNQPAAQANNNLVYSSYNNTETRQQTQTDVFANRDSNSRSSFVNGSIDNDDPSDDPDFTVTETNDLDDPDYLDDWFQVPSNRSSSNTKKQVFEKSSF
jgi:hypothetical protein